MVPLVPLWKPLLFWKIEVVESAYEGCLLPGPIAGAYYRALLPGPIAGAYCRALLPAPIAGAKVPIYEWFCLILSGSLFYSGRLRW